ncbi:MAG: sigma-70 family RNA polymerase sigma factor [Muribaculaceae bacterium]|nr:sigma-70 family RNA polymerase sigma factor [Muribaculaceae bacterium]
MTSEPISEKHFAELIGRHSGIINKVSYFYATDRMPYEDMRQEIYAGLWKALPKFRGECSMKTWIYRVAVNSALMAIRSTKQKSTTVSIDIADLNLSTEPEDELKENILELYAMINQLEYIDKAIILLWLDEFSYQEIADTLGLKRGTIATRIFRIKEKLSKSF